MQFPASLMDPASSDLWPVARLFVAIGGIGALLGALKFYVERKLPAATVELTLAQTRKADAEARKLDAEAHETKQRASGDSVEKLTRSVCELSEELRRLYTRLDLLYKESDTLKAERDHFKKQYEIADARVRILEEQVLNGKH